MTQRFRTILLASIILFAATALILLIYVVFFRSDTGPQTATNQNTNQANTNTGGLPNINTNTNSANANNATTNTPTVLPGIDTVANGNATTTTTLTPGLHTSNATAFHDGNLRYYNDVDGQFYRLNTDGTISRIGDARFVGATNITWANRADQVIVEFPDGANVFYNLDTDQQVTLPKEYEDFDFSPDANQIVFKYMHQDEERRVLAVSNPDGSGARALETLGENDKHVTVNWSPTGKVAATYANFIDLNRQEVGFIGLNDENFKGTVVEGRGLRYQYSPDGLHMLYSVYTAATDYNPGVWLVDANGDDIGKNRIELNLTTSADKCTFSADGKRVYCAVPTDPKYGFGLEPDILEGVPDEIFRIDLGTGLKTRIALPVDSSGRASYRIDNMSVTQNDSALVFHDIDTDELVRLNLQ